MTTYTYRGREWAVASCLALRDGMPRPELPAGQRWLDPSTITDAMLDAVVHAPRLAPVDPVVHRAYIPPLMAASRVLVARRHDPILLLDAAGDVCGVIMPTAGEADSDFVCLSAVRDYDVVTGRTIAKGAA